jgi:histone-lysine N-methyltransferase SETD2
MEDDDRIPDAIGGLHLDGAADANVARVKKERRSASLASTPNGSGVNSRASSVSPGGVVKAGSDTASTPDNGSGTRLTRKAPQKQVRSTPALFLDCPDATEESYSAFQLISDCLYGSKHMGASEHDALDCDCNEEWRKYFHPSPISSTSPPLFSLS